MIKQILTAVVAVQLVGCAAYGNMMNAQDPCQSVGKPADYKKPSFCGASQRIPRENAANQLSIEYLDKLKMAMTAGQYSTACSYARMNSNVVMNLNDQARYQRALELQQMTCDVSSKVANRG